MEEEQEEEEGVALAVDGVRQSAALGRREPAGLATAALASPAAPATSAALNSRGSEPPMGRKAGVMRQRFRRIGTIALRSAHDLAAVRQLLARSASASQRTAETAGTSPPASVAATVGARAHLPASVAAARRAGAERARRAEARYQQLARHRGLLSTAPGTAAAAGVGAPGGTAALDGSTGSGNASARAAGTLVAAHFCLYDLVQVRAVVGVGVGDDKLMISCRSDYSRPPSLSLRKVAGPYAVGNAAADGGVIAAGRRLPSSLGPGAPEDGAILLNGARMKTEAAAPPQDMGGAGASRHILFILACLLAMLANLARYANSPTLLFLRLAPKKECARRRTRTRTWWMFTPPSCFFRPTHRFLIPAATPWMMDKELAEGGVQGKQQRRRLT